MTISRRIVIAIAGATAALILIAVGPAETALGARFPFPRQGQHDGRDGADGQDGRGVNNRGNQGGQGGEGGESGGDDAGRDGENGQDEDLNRGDLTPAQRARLQAREAKARFRGAGQNF